MHLHRFIVGGFPKAEPLEPAKDAGYASGLYQIAGHFDEHAFFPFLEEIGLAPRNEVGAEMQRTARLLANELESIQADGPTDYWRVLLSAIYVQAQLIAPAGPAGRDRVPQLYSHDALAEYA